MSIASSISARRTVLSLAMLAGATHLAAAQSPAQHTKNWELRATSGGLVPTGAERNALKAAQLSAAQLSYVITPQLAITGTVGWARSRDLATANDPKLDVFTYDLGAEARGSEWFADKRVTLTPFTGAGAGARSYNYRNLTVDATHNAAVYATVGGELGMGHMGVRLEARDYVTSFKPLVGGGKSDTRNDVVIMVGFRFDRGRE